mmetsp:Transcript_3432/g.3390  ORF Transcript_3432/g.3390 Transcript_3432/m.3390 type:complete len:142 (+) Transcript_3432:158-583(+)
MKTVNIVSNLGFVFVFTGLLIIFIIVLMLYKLISLKVKSQRLEKIYTSLSNKLFYNTLLRSVLQAYLLLAISTFLNLKVLAEEGKNNSFNLGLTVLTLIIVVFYPLSTFFFLEMNHNQLEEKAFKQSFHSLYLNTHVGSFA